MQLMEQCLCGTLRFNKGSLRHDLLGFAADGQYFAVNTVEHIGGSLCGKSPEDMNEDHCDDDVLKMMQWMLCTWDGAHMLELALSDVRQDKQGVGVKLHEVP